ncbi:hypothetical protein U1Q18_010954 [Sarracenia purpurea var. burkii]
MRTRIGGSVIYASRQIHLEDLEVRRKLGLTAVDAVAAAATVNVERAAERHAAAEDGAAEVRHQGEVVAAEGMKSHRRSTMAMVVKDGGLNGGAGIVADDGD